MNRTVRLVLLAAAAVAASFVAAPSRVEAVPAQVIVWDYFDDPGFTQWVGGYGHDCNTGNAYRDGRKGRYRVQYTLRCHNSLIITGNCYDLGANFSGDGAADDLSLPPNYQVEQVDCDTGFPE